MNNDLNGKLLQEGITFDDVLLVPAKSTVLPNEVDLKTKLTKNITLNIPFMSSAMDTVTESGMGIAMATLGGIGIIHKNLSIELQAAEVKKVKEFTFDKNNEEFKNAATDKLGRLISGAAVSTGADTIDRVQALVDAGVDAIVVDSAHGHSQGILDTVKKIRSTFKDLDIIAGNIVTAEAAQALVEAGADCVKVGVGPGSICTTRVVAGVGVPQISAVNDIFAWADKNDIPLIADGGIKYSGDIVKAIAAGGSAVMLGSMFAGTLESPGEVFEVQGKQYKTYVGMGSLAAMERGSSDRYFQKGNKKLVPEGIEARVPFKGSVNDIVFQLIGGLRSGMGYTGSKDIEALRHDAKFVKITGAGLKESHPHDVDIVKAAPNYSK